MKKIGILTHYQVHNHGALLQMYGLKKVLQALGAEPFVLTYEKNYDFVSAKLKNKYSLCLKSVPYYFLYMARNGLARTLFNIRKHAALNKFKKLNFNFTPLAGCAMDAVCVGSDEVFSLEVGFNKMMYGIGVESAKIFSYAPSFGQTDIAKIKEKGCFDAIKNGLLKFNTLSVRDKASAQTVQQLTGLAPQIVCDPALLYGFEAELKAASKKTPKSKYVLIYAYDDNMNEPYEVAAIKKYAAKRGLLVVSAGFYHSWADKNINVSPAEFAALFKRAEAVITDTFHGSIFAALANVPFAANVRSSNINKMTSLLETVGLSDSLLTHWEDLPLVLSHERKWSKINENIKNLRESGVQFIKKALDEK